MDGQTGEWYIVDLKEIWNSCLYFILWTNILGLSTSNIINTIMYNGWLNFVIRIQLRVLQNWTTIPEVHFDFKNEPTVLGSHFSSKFSVFLVHFSFFLINSFNLFPCMFSVYHFLFLFNIGLLHSWSVKIKLVNT